MKIGVIGASGKAGSLIAAEAKGRGHEVTAIVRDKAKVEGKGYTILEKDLFKLTAEDIKQFEMVICAFGTPFDGSANELHQTAADHFIKIFKAAPDTRLMVIGGAGSLYTDSGKKRQALEDIPEEWRGVPASAAKAFEKFKASGINWTYFSPAFFFDPEGKHTGKYTPGTDFVFNNKQGESYLSYADAAVALVDEAENGFYVQKRFTAVSEKETLAAENKKEGYYGILKKKPVFEGGISQYREPFNYELAGKSFRMVMDLNSDYFVNFLTGNTLEFGEFDKPAQKYYYECGKGDETTYFVNFELKGAVPRTGLTLILDLEQRLVTFNRTCTDFSEKYPLLVESEFDFGTLDIPGYPLPRIRHSYTADLVGKRILWVYSPEFKIIHVYYSPHYIRADFPAGALPPTTSEQAEEWEKNPYDEKATYIKIKRNMYALNIIEQNMSKRGEPGNCLFFLMDLERVHDVGRSFGHRTGGTTGGKWEPENYLFSAYGDFVASDGKIESQQRVYSPE
jgi:putative NADH-flavin reductase